MTFTAWTLGQTDDQAWQIFLKKYQWNVVMAFLYMRTARLQGQPISTLLEKAFTAPQTLAALDPPALPPSPLPPRRPSGTSSRSGDGGVPARRACVPGALFTLTETRDDSSLRRRAILAATPSFRNNKRVGEHHQLDILAGRTKAATTIVRGPQTSLRSSSLLLIWKHTHPTPSCRASLCFYHHDTAQDVLFEAQRHRMLT
ncbi:hypothetical protein U9M48_025297 [Paspalum notatum var. saurae]|uniref:Uncharacterized protein n=1 Tax=Paspalum notatum var. saurae TaxID=547442 RepID=A0AAQ3TUN1_PASNO